MLTALIISSTLDATLDWLIHKTRLRHKIKPLPTKHSRQRTAYPERGINKAQTSIGCRMVIWKARTPSKNDDEKGEFMPCQCKLIGSAPDKLRMFYVDLARNPCDLRMKESALLKCA
uniref:Uncharacterized protein n=1 Tax=Steinernema glaseri TaxID=37863 RepID=A0A1I8AKR5_9BILA